MDSPCYSSPSPGDFLHQLFIVGGITKVANTEGPGLTLGVALRLGDIKLLYVCRFNQQDYPHHIIGVAGTIKMADLIPK